MSSYRVRIGAPGAPYHAEATFETPVYPRALCIRCGQSHSGPLSVCDECDGRPRCSAVDELLAEVRELREELAAVKTELAAVKAELEE